MYQYDRGGRIRDKLQYKHTPSLAVCGRVPMETNAGVWRSRPAQKTFIVVVFSASRLLPLTHAHLYLPLGVNRRVLDSDRRPDRAGHL